MDPSILLAGVGGIGSMLGNLFGSSSEASEAKKALKLQKEMFDKQQQFLQEGRDKAVQTLQNPELGLSSSGKRAQDRALYELGMVEPPNFQEYLKSAGNPLEPGYEQRVLDMVKRFQSAQLSYHKALKDPDYGRANKQYSWNEWLKNPLYSAMPDAALGEELLKGPQLDERGPKTGLGEFERQYGFKPFPTTEQEILDADPGYRFTKQQGLKAVNNQAAKMGQLYSGGRDKAIAEYTTGLANTTYGDILNRHNTLMNSFVDRMTGRFNAKQESRLRNWEGQSNTWNKRLDQARTGFQGALDNDQAFKDKVLGHYLGMYDYQNSMNQSNKQNIAHAYLNTASQQANSADSYASGGANAINRFGQAVGGGYKALGEGFSSGLQGIYGAYSRDQENQKNEARWGDLMKRLGG